MEKQKLPKGEKQIRQAFAIVSKEVEKLRDDIKFLPDCKYELGKAWGIVKEYLNIK